MVQRKGLRFRRSTPAPRLGCTASIPSKRILYYINDIENIQNQLEHLPTSLDDAYSRVLQQIHTSQDPQRRKLTRSILGWVGCAPTPMTLQEIEQALLVNPDHPLSNLEFRQWLMSYIFSTKVENYLPISEMALDLAIRCMVYLCQDHHEPDLTEDEIDANILWGAYRLHYFSSGFWLDLINEYLTLSSSATLPNTLIDQLRVLFGTRQSEDHTQTDQDATCLHPAILALESREPVLRTSGSTPAHSLFPKFPSLSIVGWTILLNRDNHEKHRQKPWNCNYPGCRYATNGFISRKMSDHHLKDGHSHIADPPLPKPAPTEKIADEEIQPLMFDLIETNQVEAITSLIPRLDNLGRPVQRELSIHAARMGSSSILQLFDDCCLLKRAFLTDSHLEWKEFRQLASLAVRSESVSSSKVLLCWVAALDLPVVKDRAYFAITIMNILSANLVVESQELFDLWRPSLCSGFEIPDMAVDTANGLAMQGNIISTDNISNREHMLLGIWEELNILDTITARTRHSILA
ncbi:hypothetical protein FOXB_13411 [Fusarium oxysporum f. sp. conglutinans Fo5176]|uniref:C2H2-type domain-containing protein n=1 Tax=Fusarium oxysporum (strain Fo5176) TaxID=660025 RepID=F9G429_FUSOF|nr:hypothetical protein FOXB_13411 [Fusarium oxysporum f. sp. conglutinans Fo5176]